MAVQINLERQAKVQVMGFHLARSRLGEGGSLHFLAGRLPEPSFIGNDRDSPRTIADFDPAQFFVRFWIDNGDVV